MAATATQHTAVTSEPSRFSSDVPQEQEAIKGTANGAAVQSNGDIPASSAAGDAAESARLDGVLNSDIGVSTLLNRLKQSISSAHDFEIFLKRRATLEEEHAQGLKKLSRGTFELIRRPENRQGSFAQNYEEVTRIHDRMADHGLQYAMSLRQMSEDSSELQASMERGRKQWKQNGLNAEKRVQDSEAALDKAKTKYDSLADSYDRARTGDRQSGRFGIKVPKSAAQQEEDLLRKVQGADADYAAKVQAAQAQRQELNTLLRPQAISALRELISECDSGLTLQLQKFASLNEQLLLRNGLCVSPLNNQSTGDANQRKSLRQVASNVDNDRDFHDYVMSFSNKAGARPPEIKYEKHPALASPRQVSNPTFPPQQAPFNGPPASFPNQGDQRDRSGIYGQSYNQNYPSQQRQISGVTPYKPQSRDGLPTGQAQHGPGPMSQAQMGPIAMGPGGQYQSGLRQTPYTQNQGPHQTDVDPRVNNYGPSQLPPLPQGEQIHQSSVDPRLNKQGSSQLPQLPPVGQPHQTNVDPRVNNQGPSQLPQLPPIGDLSMSGANPSQSYHDRQISGSGPGVMNNKYRDGRPDGASIVSPLTPPPGLQPATMGPQMAGGSANNYRPVGPGGRAQNAVGRPANGSIDTSDAGASMPGQYNNYQGEPPPTGLQSAGGYDRSAPGPSNNYKNQAIPPFPEGARSGTHSHSSSNAPAIFNNAGNKRAQEAQRPYLPPLRPVFGVSLDELFRRDSSAVPMIVYQCVQAVDLFGLDVEGIYRTSGSAPHIAEMKAQFDHDSSQLDFRNPSAFHHDIASVTTLLKYFIRDLPDPLLTSANYTSFINAAKIDDDIIRRDSLHAIINSLPDPNYATLRVLTLHLHRVAEHAQSNRMTLSNLGICWGPTLMGQHGGGGAMGDIRDAGFQARVVETILANTFQIFDDDE